MKQDYFIESATHCAEYLGGFLFITEKDTGKDYPVRLTNTRGQCITRGQFSGSCATHGFEKACEVFKKLAAVQC